MPIGPAHPSIIIAGNCNLGYLLVRQLFGLFVGNISSFSYVIQKTSILECGDTTFCLSKSELPCKQDHSATREDRWLFEGHILQGMVCLYVMHNDKICKGNPVT